MFLKIKFNGQIYLIAQSRVQYLQKLIEIVEKNFTKLPQVYQFTCIDAKGNKKSLRSQQTLGQFRQKMKNLQEILIVSLQISNQLSLKIQTVREKIQHQSARANEKSNDLKRPDKYEKKKSDSKQQNKQISLRKVASGDQPQNKYENQLQLNMFKRQVIGRRRKPQQSIEVNIPSNNGSLDELAAQNLAIILQIPISQAIVHIRKYPSRNIEQIINIIMEGTN